MIPARDLTWPAQKPTRDFASRAVDAMLKAGAAPRSAKRPRFVMYLAMAAVLATGTALAIVGARSRSHTLLTADAGDPVVMGAPSYSIRARSLAASQSVSRAPSMPSAQRRVAASPSGRPAPAGAAPSVRVPLRQPACQCERGFSDFICDCY